MERTTHPKPLAVWPDLVAVWLLGLALPTTLAVASLLGGRTVVLLTDRGLLRSILFEACSLALLALYWRYRGRLREMSAIQITWASTRTGLLLAIGSLVGYFVAAWGMLLATRNAALFSTVKLVNQTSLSVALLMCLVNPIFEEVLVSGCVIRILERHGAQVAIGMSVLFRLAYHLYQGPLAIPSILPGGILFAAYYWKSRNIWPLILAHAVLDLAGLTLGS